MSRAFEGVSGESLSLAVLGREVREVWVSDWNGQCEWQIREHPLPTVQRQGRLPRALPLRRDTDPAPLTEGAVVGASLGLLVGLALGLLVGWLVGWAVGWCVGCWVGRGVGGGVDGLREGWREMEGRWVPPAW